MLYTTHSLKLYPVHVKIGPINIKKPNENIVLCQHLALASKTHILFNLNSHQKCILGQIYYMREKLF